MFIDFRIYNTKHNPPKIIKYVVENSVFLFLWMSFMVLEIWLFGVGKVLEICFKDFVRTLGIA